MYNYENTLNGGMNISTGGMSEIEMMKKKMAEQEQVILNMQKQMTGVPLSTGIQQAYQRSDRFFALMGKFAASILEKNALVSTAFKAMPEYQQFMQALNADFAEYEKSYIQPAQAHTAQQAYQSSAQPLQQTHTINQNNGGNAL